MANNLYFGRGVTEGAEAVLTLLYEEGVLSDETFFRQLTKAFDCIENKDGRIVVLTGTFPYPREEILEAVKDCELQTSTGVSKDSWLWCGRKPGQSKLREAVKLGVEISYVVDLMKYYLRATGQKYIQY